MIIALLGIMWPSMTSLHTNGWLITMHCEARGQCLALLSETNVFIHAPFLGIFPLMIVSVTRVFLIGTIFELISVGMMGIYYSSAIFNLAEDTCTCNLAQHNTIIPTPTSLAARKLC